MADTATDNPPIRGAVATTRTAAAHRQPAGREVRAVPGGGGATTHPVATAQAVAVLRVATGFIFLWAFLDKLVGLGYSTTSAKSWIHGGSPTLGFLKSVDVGPTQSLMHSMAGTGYADWLFMLALLGIGTAVVLGVALRLSAVAGVLLLAGMWLAEFAPARFTAAGTATGSANPFVDYHVVYALVLVVLALTAAGSTWGLGRAWSRLTGNHAWLA